MPCGVSHMHAYTHTDKHSFRVSVAFLLLCTHADVLTHTHMHMQPYAYTYTHTETHTHTHTHKRVTGFEICRGTS